MATDMTAFTVGLLDTSILFLEAEIKHISDIRVEVKRLTDQLEALKQTERTATGHRGHTRRARKRAGLTEVKRALTNGATGIPVYMRSSKTNPIPGAIVKRTPARLRVLTEKGEMEFDLKPRSDWRRPGDGRGDWGAYRINMEHVEEKDQ